MGKDSMVGNNSFCDSQKSEISLKSLFKEKEPDWRKDDNRFGMIIHLVW